MTASKIQMDQIRSTSATVTGENIRAGSQKKSSLSPAEGLQGASPDATCTCPSGNGSLRHPCPAHPAVEQAGGDERAVDGKPRATKCPDCGEGDLMPGDLCACGYETDPAAGYACSECDGSGDGYVGEVCRECDGSGWFVTPEQARAALAQPSPTTDSRPAEWSSYDPTWVVDFIRDNSIFNADLIERMLEYATRPAGDVPQAEQAEAERPEGPTEDELEAAGLGYPLHKEEAVKLWYSGFRSEVITVLEAWEAIGHDIGMNPDKGELLDSLRYMLEKCEAHDAALAEVAGLRSLLNSLLCYVERDIDRMRSDRDKSDNKEIYDRSISLAMERLKAAQNAVFTTEPGCDTAVELAAQTTQAQHCVPELLVRAEDFVSGKEVPQAWLDVQAERRRQITAEGWTPDHDDLYCAAELPRAAAAYILSGANDEAPAIWPFSAKWWKPRDARANYMRAGALILAEIERLDRAAAAGKEVGHE
ncbi:hypothetical protein [Pseudomonas aeruginosa]|uniref:hypothetical protein n=2 Tax=Pseudomonas aeruginosa TaxID=287 RepID=UPI00088D0CAD|nr:hypothetical protein [Pseudomonas aeruginosa]SCZ15931.1 Uncharacterised protein [Acinetobacter baumannii]MCV6282640.1 hypothetical protein [Pseudomonas aeruginosa]MCV6285666.1 hypothetical protein [Pseudomonas aeruginosa]MDG3856657.1 hypothetical protein [Pseudomonas aeruginosa]MDG4086434.1 hypothetical protein [Pseudomonas aeruginosa]